MDNQILIDKSTIVYIAKTISRAFRELQKRLTDGTLTAAELDAIDSLPSGVQDRRSPIDGSLVELVDLTGRKRIAGFPQMCCADVTATLGIIYTMAGVKPEAIFEMKAVPRKPNPAFNFHKWLSVEELRIDLTLGQFQPLGSTIGGAVVFNQHPFEVDDEYTIEKSQFVPPTQIVKFAEYIGFAYIFEGE